MLDPCPLCGATAETIKAMAHHILHEHPYSRAAAVLTAPIDAGIEAGMREAWKATEIEGIAERAATAQPTR